LAHGVQRREAHAHEALDQAHEAKALRGMAAIRLLLGASFAAERVDRNRLHVCSTALLICAPCLRSGQSGGFAGRPREEQGWV
ncbi:MAG TPA: hypothetical protein VGQ91_11090, partial [Ideonella sp.]|nr:hypothetical protein [Ideonella sp.]